MKSTTFIKRFLLFFLIVFNAVLVAGCQKNSPERAVKAELDLIQSLDEDTIKAFVSYKDMMQSPTSTTDVGTETAEAVKLFFKNFRYEITGTTATQQTATVNTEITNLNTKAVAKDVCKKIIANSLASNITSDTPISLNDYFQLLGDTLKENEYELVTWPVSFDLVKKEDVWEIQTSEELEDELVGGFIKAVNDPYLLTPEEVFSITCDYFKGMDAEEWLTYLGMDDIFTTGVENYHEIDLAFAEQICSCFDYQIDNADIEDDSAQITATITSMDGNSVMDDYAKKIMDYAATTESVRASDAEISQKNADFLLEALKNNKATVSTSVSIPLSNNGTAWEVQITDEFISSLLGNFSIATETFQQKTITS